MNGLDDVSAAIDHTAIILAQNQIPHAFGGALAQNYWGVVRATQDVDVLFSPMLPFQNRILERAVMLPWKDSKIPVTTAEDLILLKMVFHREKDIRDIRAMIATRGAALDRAHLLAQASGLLDAEQIAELLLLLGSSS